MALVIVGSVLLTLALLAMLKRRELEDVYFHMLPLRPDSWGKFAKFGSYSTIVALAMCGGLMLAAGLGLMGEVRPLP